MDEVLTAQEVSKLLKVTKDTVYRLVRLKQIPHFKVGRNVRFHREEIEKFMKGDKAKVLE